jgi:hypothetical protein
VLIICKLLVAERSIEVIDAGRDIGAGRHFYASTLIAANLNPR